MSRLWHKIQDHHEDEAEAFHNALPTQKLRVSLERRIFNMEKLVTEEVPESHEKHVALAAVSTARRKLGEMLNKMDEGHSIKSE